MEQLYSLDEDDNASLEPRIRGALDGVLFLW